MNQKNNTGVFITRVVPRDKVVPGYRLLDIKCIKCCMVSTYDMSHVTDYTDLKCRCRHCDYWMDTNGH
jgi:hypothetical protein